MLHCPAYIGMKLRQLRYLVAIVDGEMNLTAAAHGLRTSAPGIGKQLHLLEEELGFHLFVRAGRSLVRPTAAGHRVLESARRILCEVDNIRGLIADLRGESVGALSIATSHASARHALPPPLKRFRQRHPDIELRLHQGDPDQVARFVQRDHACIAIATGEDPSFEDFVRLPWYEERVVVVAPRDHPLAVARSVPLQTLVRHPLLCGPIGPTTWDSRLDPSQREGLMPDVVLTTSDSDVLKACVRAGLGIAVLPELALHRVRDADLRVVDVAAPLAPQRTWVGFLRGRLPRNHACDCIAGLAPHLTRGRILAAAETRCQREVDDLFRDVRLPTAAGGRLQASARGRHASPASHAPAMEP